MPVKYKVILILNIILSLMMGIIFIKELNFGINKTQIFVLSLFWLVVQILILWYIHKLLSGWIIHVLYIFVFATFILVAFSLNENTNPDLSMLRRIAIDQAIIRVDTEHRRYPIRKSLLEALPYLYGSYSLLFIFYYFIIRHKFRKQVLIDGIPVDVKDYPEDNPR